jgi:hypothetical protein
MRCCIELMNIIMTYPSRTPQHKKLAGLVMLLTYAEAPAHSCQWIGAIAAILARLEVGHG